MATPLRKLIRRIVREELQAMERAKRDAPKRTDMTTYGDAKNRQRRILLIYPDGSSKHVLEPMED